MKTIHTNLYGYPAADMLSAALGQLSDGWGENSRSLEKWWRFANIKTEPNGETVIEIDDEHRFKTGPRQFRPLENGFFDMSDEEIKKQFATWIRKTIYMEIKDNGQQRADAWNRTNVDFNSSYLDRAADRPITIQDIYFVTEMLNGDINLHKYSSEAIAKNLGVRKNATEEAAEKARREAAEKLQSEFYAKINDLRAKAKAEIAKLTAEINASTEAVIAQERSTFNEAKAALNNV